MKIAHVACEMAPFAKVGGLADVVLGLTREQQKAGLSPFVVLPHHTSIDTKTLTSFKKISSHSLLWKEQTIHYDVLSSSFDEIELHFISPKENQQFFDRKEIYGGNDEIERFMFFARAACDYLSSIKPDVVHLHDWQTSLFTLFTQLPTLFTIHNLNHQGLVPFSLIETLDIPPLFYPKMEDPTNPNLANLLKTAILCADLVTTVSPTYKEEILTSLQGEGLDETLLQVEDKLVGVLNGIDTTDWNPKNDPYLPYSYDVQSFGGKQENKQTLLKRLGMEPSTAPLLGAITRLVPQKGLEALQEACHVAAEQNSSYILLGTSPIPHVQEEFKQLKEQISAAKNIKLLLQFDVELSHLLYAASDFIFVPSIFEPCGLAQLIGMRYGAIPIVRKTGGLADTVFDVEEFPDKGNGFTFIEPTKEASREALTKAFSLYRTEPEKIASLQRKNMQTDYSWKQSCEVYLALYQRILRK